MAKVYFGNSVNDTISVNLNQSIDAKILEPRMLLTSKEGQESISVPAISFNIKSSPGKGTFGSNGANTVQINFYELEADDQIYEIKTEDVSGRDLYFYVFDGSLVGQDNTGRCKGIQIKPKGKAEVK